ncbi:hypothetical protein IE53DRAFT_370726 [Violaceomyces palustris]|uniref:Uncharacterized protein n=1 Tax=Violaceomyces palustris TaxID=1673888 RepID=A0ACD0NRA9_9BASI|nr:hypothetical protein IE53DRAFT_370726 [Violaceomyces palustris]
MEVARILEHLIHYSIVRSSTSIKEESHVFLYDEFKLFNRLTSNFDSPYIGEGVDQFERKVIRVYSNLFENQDGSGKKHYGRIIPIVQSSGTGKSRLVYELRKRWPTQSVCFRRNPSNPNLGFPLQDASVVDFFISPKHLNKDPNLLVAALVAAWLHQMTDTMITEATRMSELFDDWDHSDTKADGSRVPNLRRRRNFERVAQLASGWVETYPDLLQKNLNAIPEAGSDGLPLGRDAMMSLGPVKLLVQEKLEKFQDQLLSLVVVQNAMKSHGMSELPHVFFAFDECLLLQELREQQALSNRSSTTPELKLIHICRSFQIMDEFLKPKIRIWLLLLGTNSSLGKMLAMQEAEQSERGRSALRLPPWWQLPFDPLLPQIPQPRTPADVLKIDQLKYYGRPMWAGRDAHELVLVASYKLECRSDGPMKDELYRAKVQALTLLSQRVCIDIVPLRFEGDEIRNIAADAVERQMRILSSYSTDNVITTKALPESLLSLGAWFKLTSSDLGDMNYGKVLKILRENLLHDSSIDLKGVNGELFGRLLLTMAHDQTPTWKGLRVARQILVAPAVCIPSFVVTLLGTEGGTSAVKELTSLIGLNLDETHLNFTNFDTVCVPKDQVSSSFLWKCWKRGTAVQCAPGQNGVDLILPVLVGKLDLDLDGPEKVKIEEHMTYIGVQVKNRLQAVQKNACFHGPYLSRGWTHQALFSLVLDLGTETTFNESNVSAHVKVSMSSCDDSERTAAVHFAAGQTPMPCIHVRSCSPDVYPCLTDLDPFGHFSSMVRMKREVETGFYESFTNKAWLEEN